MSVISALQTGDNSESRWATARRTLRRSQLREVAGSGWRAAKLASRRVHREQRQLPAFVILGTQRGGTTSLYRWLSEHPQVGTPLDKETQFFTVKYERGADWYRRHFSPSSSGRVDFEASPYYLYHPLAPQRVAATLPGVKLIAMLRDPVARAHSHYHHNRSLGFEPLSSFAEAIEAEESRLAGEVERLQTDPSATSDRHRRYSYVDRGRYDLQLERWSATCPGQLLVLDSADIFRHPETTYKRVLEFVGLDPWRPEEFRNRSLRPTSRESRVDPAVAADIRRRVQQSVVRLDAMVDFDVLNWLDHDVATHTRRTA